MKVMVICTGLLNPLWVSPPVPALLELFLNTLSSRARLQTQLTSEGGQIPGKERWLN